MSFNDLGNLLLWHQLRCGECVRKSLRFIMASQILVESDCFSVPRKYVTQLLGECDPRAGRRFLRIDEDQWKCLVGYRSTDECVLRVLFSKDVDAKAIFDCVSQ